MKKKLFIAAVVTAIVGAVTVLRKHREYTKVRTNDQEDSVKNPYMQDFSHARFVPARTWHKLVMHKDRAQKRGME